MKKLVPIFLFIFVLPLFSACAELPEYQALRDVFYKPYTCEIAVKDNDDVYSAAVIYDGDDLVMTFSEPSILCGTSCGRGAEGGYIVYNDLKIPLDSKTDGRIVRGASIWQKLMTPDGEYSVRSSNENGKKVYIMSDGKAEYVFDADKNAPVYIKSGDITITVGDFKNTNDKPSESAGENIESGA